MPKRYYPNKCGNANRYTAARPPKCNDGKPCKACQAKWDDRDKKVQTKPLAGGVIIAPDETRAVLNGKRFVFTSAQNNTYLHEGFWNALQTFCAERDATLFVSRFTYNKNGWAHWGGISKKQDNDAGKALWYDPRIEPFILDSQVKVANDLIFCGELDILPTAAQPLNTLSNYTGPNSGIVPHAKVHMRSLATMKSKPATFMYTTGACTQRNYIERKAGQVATFHHVFAALYVEIDNDGDWFARQLVADRDGVFYDIDKKFAPDLVDDTADGECIVTLGDVHVEKLDHAAMSGASILLQKTRPGKVFVHDLIDFEPRNHHSIKDPFFLADQYVNGINSVESGMAMGVKFMHDLSMLLPNATIYSVRSNHDQAFRRWLQDHNGVRDAANASYWHKMNAKMLEEIGRGNPKFDIFAYAMHQQALKADICIKRVVFLKEDDSMVIKGIEYAMHGHRGPNGSRGTPSAFRQLGTKANTGHTHSAGIVDGVYTAGLLAKMDMGYNAGPSSWSHSNIITYPSGKRAIITQRGNKWRA